MNRKPCIQNLPEDFAHAIASMREARYRPDVHVQELPAPKGLAQYAVALEALVYENQPRRSPVLTVASDKHHTHDDALVVGRFILLYDPEHRENWNGNFRIVTYIRAHIDSTYEDDSHLMNRIWGWLSDTLIKRSVSYRAIGGTATKIMSESFGAIEHQDTRTDAELRASWTACDTHIKDHLEAWSEVLTRFAGRPDKPEGIALLPIQRSFN